MMRRLHYIAVVGTAVVLLAGCRGMESERPPIHPNLNMDFQERYDPQEASDFFADGRAMRPPVPGTVPRGMMRTDSAFFAGRTEGGAFVQQMPIPATRPVLERGQERYDIFCTPCHGAAGGGQGIIATGDYGYTPAPTYHSDRLREIEDGYLYDVITNGIRNMPGYAQQIPVADRWAIVAYVRALQLSQNAGEEDVPAGVLQNLLQGRDNISGGRTVGGTAAPDTAQTAAPDTAQAGAAAQPDTTAQE